MRGADNAVDSALDGVALVSAGGSHSCTVTPGGGGSCWGNRGSGRLGNGDLTDHRPYPAPVTVLNGGTAVSFGEMAEVSAGGYHVCARTWSGRAYCWGTGLGGQLGDGGTSNHSHPTLVGESSSFSDGGFQQSYTCAADGSSCALDSVVLSFGAGLSSLDNDGTPDIEVSGIASEGDGHPLQ